MKILGMKHQCDCCKRVYLSDNTWLACESDQSLTIIGTFCSEQCRTKFLLGRGWEYNEFGNLRPQKEMMP